MISEGTPIAIAEIRTLATDACLACGASPATARSLVDATISAACEGVWDVGFPHLLDYLARFRTGRINGHARPRIQHPFPAMIEVDADGGIAQLGFDMAFDDYVKRIRTFGVATFMQRNGFTAGELGYYVRRLAKLGILSIAAASGPPLMAVPGSKRKIYCTNPIAFGAPTGPDRTPIVIDQATSATAFVNVRAAALDMRSIPENWAVDRDGHPTTNAADAMEGALLPFGGYKGANIALMVELLAAGLSGASWAIDGGDFVDESQRIDAGLTVVGMVPAGSGDHEARFEEYAGRLAENGVHVPGRSRERLDRDHITLPAALFEKLKRLAVD